MYSLSNRQRKELLVRGTPLRIALPLPLPEPEDLLAHARRVLTGIEPAWIRQAEALEVLVSAVVRGDGLARYYGRLLVEMPEPADLEPLLVVVIEVRISPPQPRHTVGRLQWPGAYRTRSGITYPPPAGDPQD